MFCLLPEPSSLLWSSESIGLWPSRLSGLPEAEESITFRAPE